MAVNYGQVAIVPKGVWNAETQYKVNNLVEYDGSSYVAKVQPPVGTLPTDTSYWQVSAAGTKKATPDSLGTVMPDGTTTEIKEDGKLSAKTAQQNALGVVKGSDDIIVGEDGNLTVNTTFEQATEIANIIAGEAIKSVLGKVSKAIATTMSLDENALLKNMISGIDVNDGNKVPSSAYIHSLVERIGMGTALEGGFDNLTAGLNSVNNNLSNQTDRVTQLYSEMQSTFIDMSNFTRSQLEAVWGGNKLIIGFVGWKGSFSPNKNTGIVLAGGSCAVLVSVTGEIYMQSSAQNVPEWEKKGIQYADISVAITADQWITSANGLKYFNHSGWNIPVNAIGVSANISSWSGTAGNVTCSIYNNSYIQFRCENAVDWTGIVRVAYSKY